MAMYCYRKITVLRRPIPAKRFKLHRVKDPNYLAKIVWSAIEGTIDNQIAHAFRGGDAYQASALRGIGRMRLSARSIRPIQTRIGNCVS